MAEPDRMIRIWEEAVKHNPTAHRLLELVKDANLVREVWEQGYTAGHQGGYTEGLRDVERDA